MSNSTFSTGEPRSIRPDTPVFSHTIGSIPAVPRVLAVRGVLGVIAGVGILALLLWRPADTLAALGIFAGAFFAVTGVMRVIVAAVADGLTAGMRALNIVFGVLAAVLGLLILVNPNLGLLAVAIVVGVAWLFEGVAALTLIPAEGKGWWVFFGIVSLLAGVVIVVFPWVTVVPLVIVIGACLLIFGVLDIINATRIHRATHRRA